MRMPCIFLGHGSPMNVLADNIWTRTWTRLGRELPRPRAILVVSAHWMTAGIGVTSMASPPTIHDFGNFPRALQEMEYPAPGDPALAVRVRDILAPTPVVLDRSWGLDHGAWSVLCKAYPLADIPTVQLSLDMTQPPSFHFETGKRLSGLRDEGVLVVCSGNVVHNLMHHRRGEDIAYDWAVRFNDHVRECLLEARYEALVDYLEFGADAELSVPTPDHFYPLLYAAGAAAGDEAAIAIDGVHSGSMSMLCVAFGTTGDTRT